MGKNSAEYMRLYRLRRKHALEGLGETTETALAAATDRIAELEEEVRHLKSELASRANIPPITNHAGMGQRVSQAQRDAILRKVNKGG